MDRVYEVVRFGGMGFSWLCGVEFGERCSWARGVSCIGNRGGSGQGERVCSEVRDDEQSKTTLWHCDAETGYESTIHPRSMVNLMEKHSGEFLIDGPCMACVV